MPQGFLNAPNLQTRHAALLYESTLALPTAGNRINFLSYIEVEWPERAGHARIAGASLRRWVVERRVRGTCRLPVQI